MKRTSSIIAILPALAIAIAPGIALAKAGSGSSMGSRGSQTHSAPPSTNTAPSGAVPMQRSATPQAAPAHAPGVPAGAAAQGMSPRSGFMSGLMGGIIGVGIGGLLFGHGFMGGGLGGLGFLGLLFQIALIGGVLWIAFRLLSGLFSGPRPAVAQGPDLMARQAAPDGARPSMGGGAGGPPPVNIGPQDYQAFEQLLQGVQASWSNQDLNGLRGMCTPEMLGYFNEQLSEQASRGVRNLISNVRLESGDLAQAWAEQGMEYATVAMRFSMIDVTQDRTGRIIEGNPNQPVVSTEIWTFVRSRGSNWILSAIQQTR